MIYSGYRLRTMLAWCVALLFGFGVHGRAHAQDMSYDTMRFFTKQSKPEVVNAYAVSPNGRYVALSFNSSVTGSRSGITIVDLERMQILGRYGRFSYHTLAFSTDSHKVHGIGGYAGTNRLDVGTGTLQPVKGVATPRGKVGITISERNGKLLISRVTKGFNPTVGDAMRVGDELLAINEGEKPTRYSDRREWQSLIGKSNDVATKMISGHPGTWVQLRLQRPGVAEPVEVCVQRQWQSTASRRLPGNGNCLTTAVIGGHLVFESADTGELCAFISLRDIEQAGQDAISPNGKLYARIGEVVNGSKFCVEVYSLEKGTVEASQILDALNYRRIRFSADSKRLLVGTRDTIEVLDVASSQWQESLSLTPTPERDLGRVVTRRVPLGLGGPGDLYTTYRERVFNEPAALARFDVLPDETIAVCSETGDLALTNRKNGSLSLGENILGSDIEFIKATPTGRHLVAFGKGVLHIIKLNAASIQTALTSKTADISGKN